MIDGGFGDLWNKQGCVSVKEPTAKAKSKSCFIDCLFTQTKSLTMFYYTMF